jgi:hypothetical protein
MSRETEAATLTQVYISCSQKAANSIEQQTRTGSPAEPGAIEKIGMVYGAFFQKLEVFEKMKLPGQGG